MKHVFAYASSFNQPLSWNVSSVVRFEGMFHECGALSDLHRAMIYAAFIESNFRFGCSSGDPRGIYRCEVGHGVYSDCDGCGNYASWSCVSPLCLTLVQGLACYGAGGGSGSWTCGGTRSQCTAAGGTASYLPGCDSLSRIEPAKQRSATVASVH